LKNLGGISGVGMAQQQYLSQIQNAGSGAGEEAAESPAERAAEANGDSTRRLDVYA
jgi:hypothetical protein